MKVKEATKGIERKLTVRTWVIGVVGFVLAVIDLTSAIIRLTQ